jgi:hypothetical protein
MLGATTMISLIGRRTGPSLSTPTQLPDKVFLAPEGHSWVIYAVYGDEVLASMSFDDPEEASEFGYEVLHTPKALS